jgi:SP family facilitated glucose transporter-like MFS transporter 1
MALEGNKETKPLNPESVEVDLHEAPPVRSQSHERRLYRQGSLSQSFVSLGGASVQLGSSKGNLSIRSRTPSGKSIRSIVTTRAAYHEDLKQDLKRGYNRNLVFMSFIIVMGTMYQFGYNIGVLNQPVDHIRQFYNDSYAARNAEKALVTSSSNDTMEVLTYSAGISDYTLTFLWSLTTTLFVIGGMIGAFTAGFIANRFGRKRSVLLSCIPAFIGAILCACCTAASSPELLMIGRFVTGINCGMATQLAPMYLLEIAPYNLKGAFGTACQLFCTIGIFVGGVLGLREILGTASMWPVLLLLNAVPALLCCIVLPFMPESPRYLMLCRKDRDGAEKALKFIRRTDDVSADLEEMDTELQQDSSKGKAEEVVEEKMGLRAGENGAQPTSGAKPEEEKFTMALLLKTKQLRMPLFIAMFLQVIQQLSGINAIFFYSTGIYKKAGVPDMAVQYAVVVTNAVNLLMTIVAVPVMDKAGRRPLLLVPMVGMVLILALITIALKLQSALPWMSYVSIGCVLAYVICFAVGLGPIPIMIGAELFRQGPRPFAMSLAGLTNWVFTAIVAISFELIQKLTKEYTFIIFLVLMIGFTIFVFFFVPETKNKTFEEIASKWQQGDKIEVEELVDDPAYTETDVDRMQRDTDRADAAVGAGASPNGTWSAGDGQKAVLSDINMPGMETSQSKKSLEAAAVAT